uniref:ribosomal protein L2 n=1 Tax=Halimeda opuntia TaxID=118223 RepID=UPI002113D849|nr:ribosomal protein L2 [Halimeda opuntia]UTN43203.1 ribosomal protein L2 [Halimeda opuntia]
MKLFKKNKYHYQRKQGRNKKITSNHRGGGHSRIYRQIDFRKIPIDISGQVKTIEYDPNRSAQIAGIFYENGLKKYQISPIGLKPGTLIKGGSTAPLRVGNTLPLKNIPLGTNVYNIEPSPGSGFKFVRAAGTTALVMAKFESWVTIRLPSNEIRLFSKNCWATIGQVSNINHLNRSLKKAGQSRWLGIRPRVRGSAKNPVDHPHGGGEGRAPVGRCHPLTPWGKPTLGKRTRRTRKYSDSLIIRRNDK